jgi:hypothetical protein
LRNKAETTSIPFTINRQRVGIGRHTKQAVSPLEAGYRWGQKEAELSGRYVEV